jgi:hypothetical protein
VAGKGMPEVVETKLFDSSKDVHSKGHPVPVSSLWSVFTRPFQAIDGDDRGDQSLQHGLSGLLY